MIQYWSNRKFLVVSKASYRECHTCFTLSGMTVCQSVYKLVVLYFITLASNTYLVLNLERKLTLLYTAHSSWLKTNAVYNHLLPNCWGHFIFQLSDSTWSYNCPEHTILWYLSQSHGFLAISKTLLTHTQLIC